MRSQLSLPTWEQTAQTEALILIKRFQRIAPSLVEDGCGQDLRYLLDVLPMLTSTHTSRHILGGAVTALRAHRIECDKDWQQFAKICDERNELVNKIQKIHEVICEQSSSDE